MKKIITLALLLIMVLIISCVKPTCNKPYILVGTSCCLDQNDNSICDSDEPEPKPTPLVEEPQEIGQTFTINDLQADIGNVLGKTVFLTKDTELDHVSIYSSKILKAKLLGTYNAAPYYKPVTLKPEIVIEITDPEYYLTDLESFKNFVSQNRDVFIETALKSKEIFESEFKEGGLLKLIYAIKSQHSSLSEKAKYINHSEVSSVLFYDEIDFPETISGNIGEVQYVKVTRYKVNISDTDTIAKTSIPKYTQELSNINYGQSIIIQCNPGLIVALSVEEYGSEKNSYEKNYNSLGLTRGFFSGPLRRHFNLLITDAQALLKMCEQRYQFTYIRGR